MSTGQELFHLRILNAAKNFANDIALIEAETGDKLSFYELHKKSYQLATYFRKNYEIKIGEVFICFMSNDIHYPIIFLAGALLGCSLTGVSPESTHGELETYATQTRSRFIFTVAELVDVVSKINLNQKHLFVINMGENQSGIDLGIAIENTIPDYKLHEKINLQQDSVLLTPLSSGTTGAPKCVMLTHKNFNAATDILRSEIFDKLSATGGRRTTIAVLPFYHGSGFWALCYCLLEGHTSIIMKNFQAPLMLSCIEDYKVDTLNLVPSIVNFLLKNENQLKEFDVSSIKTVLCGSAPIGKDLIRQFTAKFSHVENFLQGYGMTEVVILSHITTLESMLDGGKHLGSCGKLLPGFEAKIVDDESGVECKEPGMRGELWLKSDCVMLGYLFDASQTADVIDKDGWYHTGDVVYFDEDGYYYVVDRVKDLIKVNGLQVSPVELERVILTHSYVMEAAVIGVPDSDKGEVPRAYVILHHESRKNETTSIEDIRTYVHDRIAPYKQLRGGIYIVDDLPKTSSGKILRRKLKKLVESTAETIL